jgi:hypothetical protein
MTREKLCEKIESILDCYEELTNFTKNIVVERLDPYCYGDYVDEKRCLIRIERDLGYILEVMRIDLLDHNVLSRVKYFIEKRLKAIQHEK